MNDENGHLAGDHVLVALAGLARAVARTVDMVARIGGDEFVILMPETDARAALPLAERLRTACSRAAGAGAVRVTCSVGLVTFERPPDDIEDLLASADTLMYEAKAAGGDGIRQASVGATQSLTDGQLVRFPARSGDRPRGSPRSIVSGGKASATTPSAAGSGPVRLERPVLPGCYATKQLGHGMPNVDGGRLRLEDLLGRLVRYKGEEGRVVEGHSGEQASVVVSVSPRSGAPGTS